MENEYRYKGSAAIRTMPGVGIAVPDQLNAWRIKKLKEYGVNAYRASHNPPTESVLNACDSLGVLVMVKCESECQ